MVRDARFVLPSDALRQFCQTNGIRKLSIFGSALRDDFSDDSDVDVLVEFRPGHRVGLFGMGSLQIALSEMFGRAVDLRTPADLSRHFRDEVVASARVAYDEG
jgi:hypothetical protein